MIRRIVVFCAFLAHAAAQTLTVTGDIPNPLKLTAEDLAKMPRQTAMIPARDGTKTRYDGVTLREILKRAGAPQGGELRGKALAGYVVARGQDAYQIVFTLAEMDAEFANESILVADQRDGKPLPAKEGPFRVLCPNDKAGARSVRTLEALEVVRLKDTAPVAPRELRSP